MWSNSKKDDPLPSYLACCSRSHGLAEKCVAMLQVAMATAVKGTQILMQQTRHKIHVLHRFSAVSSIICTVKDVQEYVSKRFPLRAVQHRE